MQLEQSNKNCVMSGCHGYDDGVHGDCEVAKFTVLGRGSGWLSSGAPSGAPLGG